MVQTFQYFEHKAPNQSCPENCCILLQASRCVLNIRDKITLLKAKYHILYDANSWQKRRVSLGCRVSFGKSVTSRFSSAGKQVGQPKKSVMPSDFEKVIQLITINETFQIQFFFSILDRNSIKFSIQQKMIYRIFNFKVFVNSLYFRNKFARMASEIFLQITY